MGKVTNINKKNVKKFRDSSKKKRIDKQPEFIRIAKNLVKQFYDSSNQEKRQLLIDKQSEFIRIAKNHPRAMKKKLDQTIKVELDTRETGVQAVLHTGKVEIFSLKKTLKSSEDKSYIKKKISETFRNEINNQIYEFRRNEGFIGKQEFHVGHVGKEEFQALYCRFAEENGLKFDENFENIYIEYRYCKEFDRKMPYFKDKNLSLNWQKFHRKNAKLKILTKTQNLQQKKQKVDTRSIYSPEIL